MDFIIYNIIIPIVPSLIANLIYNTYKNANYKK